jgi:hypothetical protein
MNYKKSNLYLGWFVFLIATIVYFITIEDTVSLWDCGEYITAAYKLEVGHPPGAPLFMVLGRLFSFFADPENVAVWINRLSALSSSLTILFMFWSISMLLKKIALKKAQVMENLSMGDKAAILGSAFIGALAYTFSESFWFSAVEGEVYAMSSLFTAIIFWAILKWDEEMAEIKTGRLNPTSYSPDRWILLIMFMLGLAIGVHLLGILVVPAMAYLIYFRYGTIGKHFFFVYMGLVAVGALMVIPDLDGIMSFVGLIFALAVVLGIMYALYLLSKNSKVVEFLLVGLMSVVILGFIQERVIPGSISLASKFEVSFVNTLGLPFYSGTIFFFLVLVGFFVFMIRWTRKKGRRMIYSAVMGLLLLLIGYGSFAVIVIRSNANTPLDENDPENLVTLHSYLKREQYGSAPILVGPHWNSKVNEDPEMYDDLSAFYLRRFVVKKGDKVLKAYKDEKGAKEYAKGKKGVEIVEMYYESNAATREHAVPTYSQVTLFPRMYWSQESHRIAGYKSWSGYDANDKSGGELGKDGNRLPTFGENLAFFRRYQVNWMYWRYFMWNFSGRQNDIQGHGDKMRGNWISGFSAVDNARLGNQDEFAPYFTSENPSNNRFFFLPLILAFIGVIYHFYRARKDAFVVFLAFLFTGVAIIVYLNQKPFEPRERDYAFAASFYFFAIWIGIGAYALYDAFKSFGKKELVRTALIGAMGLLASLFMDMGSVSSMPTTLSWIIMFVIGGGAIALMIGLKKALNKDLHGAVVAFLLCLSVPMIMGMQGWDDHDRSNKTTAHNVALNYLESCPQNGIIFTNGDNDTFPLWYMQEVEGKRTDVRVCNLSLMQTDWYTNQMKMKAYESDPLPIKFTEDQILMYAGNTDQVLFVGLIDMIGMGVKPEVIKKVIKLRAEGSPNELRVAVDALNSQGSALLASATATDQRAAARLRDIQAKFGLPLSKDNQTEDIYNKYQMGMEILSAAQNNFVKMSNQALQSFQNLLVEFEKNWNYADLASAMEFTRDDANLISHQQSGRMIRIFPSTGFVLPVNMKNALASGVILESQKEGCLKELKFGFEDERGLTREQVMMLDIIGNNDWKRGISFSSPGGSEVSIALYRRGYIKQNGMVFELSPMDDMTDRFNTEKMYANLMENYDFGTMSDPDVLTDYYARRHTDQYRLHFLSLAEEFVSKALRAEDQNDRIKQFANSDQPVAGLPEAVPQKTINEYKEKAKKLIKRSLEVMPAELVIDYGEPSGSNNPRDNYEINGKQLTAYSDGVLHDYVGVLYMAGDKKGAEELGMVVADQLESILTYYEKSNVGVVAATDNTKDLYAALGAYLKIMSAAHEFGDRDGALAKRTRIKIDYVYKTMFPSMMDRLKELANNNGESTRRGASAGRYANMLFDLEDYSEGIAIFYELLEAPEPEPEPSGAGGPSLDQIMNQQVPAGNPGGQ